MTTPFENLTARLRDLEDALEAELEEKRAALRYHLERRRVVFERDVRARHRAARERLGSFLARTRPLTVLTAPVIYALIVPLVLLDLGVALYQALCFPVYGIPRVRRGDYIVIDRQHLAYLNALQKLNCVYCGYANGLIALVREVAARTEAYWCPIKHASRVSDPHRRYLGFQDYGDETRYREALEAQRAALRQDTGAE
ncbi:MAG: hypothetical protein KDK26_05735 [Roseivivax sp.]|nr:hypothetical protein [Roseivivax sp.]